MKTSISAIKLFKACRRAYWFKYNQMIVPVQKSEALETGTNYHAKLEQLYDTGDFDRGYDRETAMACAFQKYIYPQFHVKAAEERFEYPLGGKNRLVGIMDAIADDGNVVEHKTTSLASIEEYEFNLQWDEQLMAYMLASGVRKVYYTICRKPTIRQKASESDEEFFERMVEWYDTDTEDKIRLVEVTRTDAEIEEFKKGLKEIMTEMTYTIDYYRNTCHCNSWGRRCEYAGICLNYDPHQEYVGFETWEADR